MPQLVRHSKGCTEPVVLDDGARGLGVTHGAQLSQAQRVAALQPGVPADVLPESAPRNSVGVERRWARCG